MFTADVAADATAGARDTSVAAAVGGVCLTAIDPAVEDNPSAARQI